MNYGVITIGRELGSGGRDVGIALSEALGIKYYDKELLKLASENSGYSKEIFEDHDERPNNSFLYSLVMDTSSLWGGYTTSYDMPINQKVFLAQFDTIKKLAHKGSCVIVGRCADYALAEEKNVCNVFIHANLDFRVKRIMDEFKLPENKAKDIIKKTDKNRANYYNYYTNNNWGYVANYNLTLDSSMLGIDGCVHMIKEYLEYMKY